MRDKSKHTATIPMAEYEELIQYRSKVAAFVDECSMAFKNYNKPNTYTTFVDLRAVCNAARKLLGMSSV